MGFRDEYNEKKRQETEQRERLDRALERIHLSTLPTNPRPFVETEILWGEVCDLQRDALASLRQVARGMECDAVLGVAFCGVAGPATRLNQTGVKGRYSAYGTGVRWTDDDPGPADAGAADHRQ